MQRTSHKKHRTQKPSDLRHHTVWRTGTSCPSLSPTCPEHRQDFTLRYHTRISKRRQLMSVHFPLPLQSRALLNSLTTNKTPRY